ncbi:MAG: RDD family protein, partial [Phycisphaerae bacterium]
HLGLFQYAANNWTYLGDLATVRMRSGYTAACSTTGNELFVRAAQTDGSDERMFRWSDGQVEPLQLPADVAGDRFVGMAAPEDRLVMVFAKPADNGRLDLHMALQDEDGGFDILPIVSGQEPVSFPSDQLPQVAAYGKEIALFWQPQEQADEETYPKIAVFDSNGEMLPASDIEVFAPSPFGGDGTAIRDAFLWIIVGLMVVLGFILRPRGAVKPFEFPQEDFQPAALWKRVVAVVIDLLPFLLLSSMLFMMQIPPDKLQQFQQRAYERAVQQDIPAALAWSVVGGMVSFGLYCAIMERKYGRTLGKMVFGLKVFGDKGQPLTWREALLRNIIKLFELNTWLFLPLWLLFCLMNPIRQRLGDVLARTAVGEKRDPNRPVIRHMTTGQVPGIPWMKPPQEQTPEQREEDEEPEETSGREDSAEPNEENDSRDQDEAPRRE